MSDADETIEEMLEIWDWDSAKPTGKSVSRKIAHMEGVPHEGVHLWIVRVNNGIPEVLFQMRAVTKESYPGCLDITVGGHVPFGLRDNKIGKEAREEIGIEIDDNDLADLGYYRYEEFEENNRFHREFQHVYLLKDNRPLDQYRFNDGEVEGIYAVSLEKLEDIIFDDVKIMTEGYNGNIKLNKILTRRDFHPLLFAPCMEEYMEIVIEGVKELVEEGAVKTRMPLQI